MLFSAVTLAVLSVTPAALASRFDRFKSQLATTSSVQAPVQYAELPIDHFNSNAGTFKNRWWFNDEFYEAGGPVIMYDVGEANAEPFVPLLQESPSVQAAMVLLAKQYKGVAIVWEHRYFGQSVPFVQDNQAPSVDKLNGDQWSYHTVEQALEDVVVFANTFTLPPSASAASKLKSPDALHASKTPWMFLGGSYPGLRAAFMRVYSPDTIFASWASSAPVQTQIDMSSYYRAVARGLPGNCSADWAAVSKFYDAAVTGSDTQLKGQVKLELGAALLGESVSAAQSQLQQSGQDPSEASDDDNADLGNALVRPLGDFQDIGDTGSIQQFCDAMETAGGQSAPSSDGLQASHMSSNQVFDAFVGAVASQTAETGGSGNDQVDGSSGTVKQIVAADSSNASADTTKADGISWFWLVCNELGFFQIADPNSSTNLISSLVTVSKIQNDCNKQFPNMLPAAPQTDNVIKKFSGWTQNPSRVMYTNGELDPWKTLSVASTENGAPMRSATTTIPPFDGAPASNSYYGAVYPGTVHASDQFAFSTEDLHQKALKTGMTMFTAALDQWMPSFKPGNDPVLTSATGTITGTAATAQETSKNDSKKNGAISVRVSAVAAVACMLTVAFFWPFA